MAVSVTNWSLRGRGWFAKKGIWVNYMYILKSKILCLLGLLLVVGCSERSTDETEVSIETKAPGDQKAEEEAKKETEQKKPEASSVAQWPVLQKNGKQGPWEPYIEKAIGSGLFPGVIKPIVTKTVEQGDDVYALFKTDGLAHFMAGKDQSAVTKTKAALAASLRAKSVDLAEAERSTGSWSKLSEHYFLAALVKSQRHALWLTRLKKRIDNEREIFSRQWVVILYDMADLSKEGKKLPCDSLQKLKVLEMDGDEEAELEVVLNVQSTPLSLLGTVTSECGVITYLVGADGETQALLASEHKIEANEQKEKYSVERRTEWSLKDLNADGHDDLHIEEKVSSNTNSSADGEKGSESKVAENCGHTREIDCPYNSKNDTWECPLPELENNLVRPAKDSVRLELKSLLGEVDSKLCSAPT